MFNMDEKDRKIFNALKENSKLSTRKIASKTGLPITTVHNRIRKLQKTGVIRKYTIIPDYGKIGLNVLAYILVYADQELLKQKNRTQTTLTKEIRKYDMIEDAYMIAGETDIIVKVRATDMDQLSTFLVDSLRNLEGVQKTHTLIVIPDTE